MVGKAKILIVEDEILIADTIHRYLSRQGFRVVGIALSYEEAIQLYENERPDLALIDIRLSGSKTGVDFAFFIQQQAQPVPFIYLTSQTDSQNINEAKKTFPSGYLSKPVQMGGLSASIEIALHNYQVKKAKKTIMSLSDGTVNYLVPLKKILYLRADHIYVQFHTQDHGVLIKRGSLTDIMMELPNPPFFKVHRSFVINLQQVTGWDQQQVFVAGQPIPVSRSNRKSVFDYLMQERYRGTNEQD